MEQDASTVMEQDASTVMEQDASPETETETETETDKYARTDKSDPTFNVPIPLNDKSHFYVTLKDIREWEKLYPAVDVRQEIRKYAGWAKANPKKRKTKRGIMKSINYWLGNVQDRGGSKKPQDTGPGKSDYTLPKDFDPKEAKRKTEEFLKSKGRL